MMTFVTFDAIICDKIKDFTPEYTVFASFITLVKLIFKALCTEQSNIIYHSWYC